MNYFDEHLKLCGGCVHSEIEEQYKIHCNRHAMLAVKEKDGQLICDQLEPVKMLKFHIPGITPDNDSDTVTNECGAKQSRLDHEWLDFHPAVMLAIAQVSARGKSKYGPRNWEAISKADHINHAITHIYKHLAGDTTEEHLSHAVCRLIFAMGVEK